MAFVRESGLTVDTRIRFLSSVYSNMSLVAIFVMKLLGTQGFFQPFWEGALGPFALGNF